jgi:hypothetical protein
MDTQSSCHLRSKKKSTKPLNNKLSSNGEKDWHNKKIGPDYINTQNVD